MKKIYEYVIYFLMILVSYSLLGGACLFETSYYVLPKELSTFIITLVVLIAVPRWTIKLIKLWFK